MEEKSNIEPIDIPPILYKYMPEQPYALNTIITRYFYFSPITDFNDPFEGKFFDNEQYSKEDLRNYFRNICHIPEEYMTSLEKIFLNDENWLIALKDRLIQEKESVEKTFGILCLSETEKDILMWSHYANSHKGIVIGIDSKNLWQNMTSSKPGGLLEPVQYKKDYPTVKFFKDQKDVVDKWFFTKYEDWKYEKEWRAVHKPGLIQFPKEIIKSVYFGAKFDLNKQAFWMSQIKDSGIHPQFYQAKLNKSSYKIDFKPI